MRPFPLPSDLPKGARVARPAVHIARAAAATLRAYTSGQTPSGAARKMFGDSDPVTDYMLRAATAPASTAVSGWAKEIAGVAIYDLVQTITSISAGADVIDRALQTNLDGIAELHIPGRVVNAAAAGQWVAEGVPIPVRAINFASAALLQPRKLAVISVFTREMVESSNIEAIVRQTLGEATGLALDARMFSNTAADASGPAGLFNGVAPLTATAGGGATPAEAAATDIGNLFAALAANGAGKTAVIVAAMSQAVKLKLIVGPKWDYDILASTALATGTVAAVETASFVSGFSSVPEFSVSNVSALHLEDTTPQNITGGTPSPAVPVKSLFQIDGLALKTELQAAYGMRATGHVAWLTGATW